MATSDKLVTFPNERKASPSRKFRPKLIANPEAERNTIGALMMAGTPTHHRYDDAVSVLGFLKPTDFSDLRYQPIYEAMQALHVQGKAFGDPVLIDAWLTAEQRLSEAGGSPFVWSLTTAVHTANSVLDYAREVFRVWSERETQNIACEGFQRNISAAELMELLRPVADRRQLVEQGGATLPGQLLSDVEREAVHWAWYGRLAYGKATMVDGDGGKGKGLITLDLTARATTGRPMPGETEAAPPMNVILIAPEDSAADTLRPRLEAAGGDPSRVRLMAEIQDGSALRAFSIPRDVELLERTIEADGAGLVIIDPIMSCLDPGVKTHVDSEVRAALMPLKQAIERTGAILIMVRHFTKASDMRAAYRGGGSVAFTNLARFGLVVADHPDNPDMCVLALAKTNYEKVAPLAYRIVQGGGDVRVEWDATTPVHLDADTLLSARGSAERREVVAILDDAAPGWLSISDVNDQLPTRLPDATLRKRLSRYADAGAILSKSGEGLYASLKASPDPHPTPSEEQSHMSQVSIMSQLSQVSQDASLLEQPTCDSVTVVTPFLGRDTSPDATVTAVAAQTFPRRDRCAHPANMLHTLKSGTTCGACGAHLDRTSAS